jgi:hypothetical protein
LIEMLHAHNTYAKRFKHVGDLLAEDPAVNVQINIVCASTRNRSTHNVPTVDEIAVILPRDDRTSLELHKKRRTLVLKRDAGYLEKVSTLNPAYDPMVYVLMFPYGEDGWTNGMPHARPWQQGAPDELADGGEDEEDMEEDVLENEAVDAMMQAVQQGGRPQLMKRGKQPFITMSEFYCYCLMCRPGFDAMRLHLFRRLFQQYVVDIFVKIDDARLDFQRSHQKELRAEVYDMVLEAADGGEQDVNKVGKRMVLTSSHPGSPRHMQAQFQDAMAIIRELGKPDLFITFTCNSGWQEIKDALLDKQNTGDRPDIVARVFRLKLEALLDDLTKKHVLGVVVAHVWTVEFQKRGLPHAHILLILADADKPHTADEYDRFVWAEIPNQATHPRLYAIVTRCMLHVCSDRCQPDGEDQKPCLKNFPKKWRPETIANVDGYPHYRRRHDGRRVQRGNQWCDNSHVVPYNAYLSLKFDAHINVEVCGSLKSVKYLFKYIHKGHDRADARISVDRRPLAANNPGTATVVDVVVTAPPVAGPNPTVQPVQEHVDEIARHVDSRYVSSIEAAYHLLKGKMHD